MEQVWNIKDRSHDKTEISVVDNAVVIRSQVIGMGRTAMFYPAAQLDTLIAALTEARRAIS